VREALETFQRSAEETWSEHMDGIEQGHYWLVEETDDVVVLAADDARYKVYLSPTGHDTMDYHHAVSGVMHSVAKRLTGYNWGDSGPLVIAKPDDFDPVVFDKLGNATMDATLTEHLSAARNTDDSIDGAAKITHIQNGAGVWQVDEGEQLEEDPDEYRVECSCGESFDFCGLAIYHVEEEH